MTSAELCGFTLKDILIAKSKKVENNFVEQSTDEFDNEIVELTFDVDDEIRESIEVSRCQFDQHFTRGFVYKSVIQSTTLWTLK